MTLASSFLTLSIREQVCITIIVLTLFSIIVILCLPCSFSYEILREDYKKKKKFFYNEYKEYIEACFYYQGYNLLKYEELIKRMLKQADKYSQRESVFGFESDFKEEYSEQFPVRDWNYNSTKDDEDRKDILYFYCYNEKAGKCEEIKDNLRSKYESLYSLIFATDVHNRFRIPEIDLPIVDKALTVSINNSFMFSFDKNNILNNINTNFVKDAERTIDFISRNVEDYVRSKFFLYDRLYEKVEYEMESFLFKSELEDGDYNKEEERERILDFSKSVSGYYSSVQFDNDKSRLFSYNPNNDNYYYLELYMSPEFISSVHQSLSNELNMNFIPLYHHNDTLMLSDACVFFLMKQSNDIFTEEALNDLLKKIIKGNSSIKDCFLDKDNFENQKIIKETFEKVEAPFLHISNKIHQGIFRIGDKNPFYFMKYSFPNLNLLKNFQSDYLLLDQINFYLLASFKEPIEYSDYIWDQYRNLFYLIVILILYIWILCLIINMLIFCKVIKQITEPIYKLQKAIESNNIKDESVFKYEYDDIINELFITCKELLTRQIDTSNNTKYSNQFNILNSRNDKNNLIDKSKYEKNLIINNDIMNQLINEQQNMNDLSGNIDINNQIDEDFEGDDNFDKIGTNENIIHEDTNQENIEKNKNIIIQNKISDDKEKESYKSLFRLAEYLYYYRCKNEENLITVNGAVPDESKKSNKSKINKAKKKISKIGSVIETEENITINMLKDKDLTYMWYMEAKKKKNRSFNYHISEDYEELFMDFDEQ